MAPDTAAKNTIGSDEVAFATTSSGDHARLIPRKRAHLAYRPEENQKVERVAG
jgi:hypothetical protein